MRIYLNLSIRRDDALLPSLAINTLTFTFYSDHSSHISAFMSLSPSGKGLRS